MDISYSGYSKYIVGQTNAEGKGVHELKRPKTCYEVNKFKHTPYTEQRCGGVSGCGEKLGNHFYLPFLGPFDTDRLGVLWCRRDATNRFTGIFKS